MGRDGTTVDRYPMPLKRGHRLFRHPAVAAVCLLVLMAALAACSRLPEHCLTLGSTPAADRLRAPCDCSVPAFMPMDGGPGIVGRPLDPDGFRLFNWNVQKGGHDGWKRDLVRLGQGSDLVTLQEARLTPALRDGLGRVGLHGEMAPAFTWLGADTGVLTAARSRTLDACQVRVPEPLLRTPKCALLTRYALAGGDAPLLVANLHAVNFSPGTGAYRRQWGEIESVLAGTEGPMIVTGDFNTWSGRRHEVVTAVAARLGLTVVDFAAGPRTRILGRPVDHVYYRGLAVLSAETIAVASSDHNPVVVTFSLPPAENR